MKDAQEVAVMVIFKQGQEKKVYNLWSKMKKMTFEMETHIERNE